MLNHIDIAGRLVRDPETRETNSGKAVATFAIACDRDYGEKQTDFMTVVAWERTAQFVSNYFKQGDAIIISGRLQMRQWKDRDEKTHTVHEIVAEHAYFGGSKRNDAPQQEQTFTEDTEDDGHLPF